MYAAVESSYSPDGGKPAEHEGPPRWPGRKVACSCENELQGQPLPFLEAGENAYLGIISLPSTANWQRYYGRKDEYKI